MKFLTELSNYVLPNGKEIKLDKVSENDEDVRVFLLESFPDKVNKFFFNNYGEMIPISHYLESIMGACMSVVEHIEILNCSITNDELVSLFSASREISDTIGLKYCNLCTDSEPDFSNALKKPKFKTLRLSYSGKHSDWENKPERFANFIRGISKIQGIHKEFKQIYLGGCCMTEEFIRETLDECEFKNVEIWTYSYY